ncbi:MAG: MFS transporter [Pegethrix bostrychoides GSE-TBD4-15B]|uniref:MFS transporter n=1 Tax=Pegethrix bostrychoides GSE-TBD4-15B TaxID=2839662 RepID=A0A951U5M1_9CYAN|nr:MFS transporter [Pegethrix bostrychoides GSE-TBD4-15B]
MPDETRTRRIDRRTLGGLCLTLFMIAYSMGVMPPLMPLIVNALDSSMGYIQSVLVLFSLVTASFAPTSENLCRFYGRKPIFVGGLLLYGIGIAITALSSDMAVLVVSFSLLTGLGATPLVSAPWAVMTAALDGKAKEQATLGFILCSVLGGLTGAILGGLLGATFGWRWAFAPAIGMGLIILLLSKPVPNVVQPDHDLIDWVGGLFSFLGLGSILVGISLAGEYGWWIPKRVFSIAGVVIPPFAVSIVPILIAVGVVCLGLFTFWQRQVARSHSGASLLRVGLLRKRSFVVGLLVAMLHTLITTGVQFNLYQFLPTLLPLNAFEVALTVLPYTLTMVVVLIILLKFVILENQIPPRYAIQIGLALLTAGLWLLYRTIDVEITALSLMPALIVMGSGSGLFLAYISALTQSVAAPEERAESAGIYNPVQNLGSSLGRGILGTLLIFFASQQIVDSILSLLGKELSAEQRQSTVSTLQAMIQTYSRPDIRAAFSQLPETVQASLPAIIQNAAVSGIRTVLLVSLMLSGLCCILSMALPKYPVRRR